MRRIADVSATNELIAPAGRTLTLERWYMRAGEAAAALEWLRRSLAARDQGMPYVGVDQLFEGIRGDPEFQDLLWQMKSRPVDAVDGCRLP